MSFSMCVRKNNAAVLWQLTDVKDLPGDWQVTQEPKTFLILQFPLGPPALEQKRNKVYMSVQETSYLNCYSKLRDDLSFSF